MERELRISERENERLRESPSVATNVSERQPRIIIKSVGDLLSNFTGTDNSFKNWEKQLQLLISTYRLEEQEAKILLGMRLKDKALNWFQSRPEHIEWTVLEILGEMKRLFDPRRSKLHLRRQFEERKWQFSEDFATYFHDKVFWLIPCRLTKKS